MKKCPFCAEEIQDEAIKCKHCGEFLLKQTQDKWYLRTHVLVISFLVVGPLALPLVWLNPRFSQKTKVIITVIVLIISYFLWVVLSESLKTIHQYYQAVFEQF